MGYDYSYDCTRAEIVEELLVYGETKVLLCNLWFQDEHGHDFAPDEDVVVVWHGYKDADGGAADVEDCAENLFEDSDGLLPYDEAIHERFSKLCRDIGYSVYNKDELGKMLKKQKPLRKPGQGASRHQFAVKVVLYEEVDGTRSEIMAAWADRPAATVHNAPRRALKAMADDAAKQLGTMFLKSRRGGGR